MSKSHWFGGRGGLLWRGYYYRSYDGGLGLYKDH